MTTAFVTKTEEKYPKLEDNINTKQTCLSPYYDETVPTTDPKFLWKLRRWEKEMGFVTAIRWTRVLTFTVLHMAALAGLVEFISQKMMWQTWVFEYFFGTIGGFGVTGGVHRYWTHRSYKAKLPLRIILIIAYSIARQDTILDWVLNHRLHHKMSETSADPHDASRGFFFSHIGWLMMKAHPHVDKERKKIDVSDLMDDFLVQVHTRYFRIFELTLCFILPILLPVLCWHETWTASILAAIVRYVCTLHFTWSVNSIAHLWGNKPYNIHIMPVENWSISVLTMGEGWHNYHHTFPWDYKAAELSYFLNLTTFILDTFALLGWAYDMKQAPPSVVKSVVNKRGPGRSGL